MQLPAIEWDEEQGVYVKNRLLGAFEELNKLPKGTLVSWVVGFMVWANSGQDPGQLQRLLEGELG
jgi:hypothetical protein